MLRDEVYMVDALALTPSTVGQYCEGMLDADRLRDELLGHGPFTRKSFCEFLGIQESTLTRWLQAGRLPRTAAAAYVLFLALQVMQDEVRRLNEEAEDLKVIETNGKYAVCRFRAGEDHAVLGKVIAENIADLGTARALAAGVTGSTMKLLEECDLVIGETIDRTDDPGYEADLRELSDKVSDFALLATDHKAWKQKHRPLTLDDF